MESFFWDVFSCIRSRKNSVCEQLIFIKKSKRLLLSQRLFIVWVLVTVQLTCLTHSCKILKNGQKYIKNLATFTQKDFERMFGYFLMFCVKGLTGNKKLNDIVLMHLTLLKRKTKKYTVLILSCNKFFFLGWLKLNLNYQASWPWLRGRNADGSCI